MMNDLPIARIVRDLRNHVRDWRNQGLSVGVVPTMGALHAGHLSLIEHSRSLDDKTIVTLFVNPKQFNDPGDLSAYPKTEQRDAALVADAGGSLLFAPGVDEMYPEGFATSVSVSRVSEGLCGANRAGHFDGVATVVTKLFLQSAADRAYFGEKDYQQLLVVRQFVRDLDIPIEIVGCETVREDDGLALSSRNAYLTSDERKTAPAMYRTLCETRDRIRGGSSVSEALAAGESQLTEAGFADVDYLELRDAETLEPLSRFDGRRARLLAAAHLGKARLIDNIAL